MNAEKFILDNIDQYAETLSNDSIVIDENYINNCQPGLETFATLLSPKAAPFLEQMAVRAQQLTWERFGRVIRLYAPLYVSNECTNACVYCGFNAKHRFDRKTLNLEEIEKEVEILAEKGIRHVLLVSGESKRAISPELLAEIANIIHDKVPSISIEVAPFATEEYKLLVDNGIEGLAVYQETYDQELYKEVHPAGKKSNYSWRVETPERGAKAGMRHISLGVLLGLSKDWRRDSLCIALHLQYMLKNYWRVKYSVSLPRLCECEGGYPPASLVSDKELAQLIFAYRLAFPDVGVNLSTREAPSYRNGLAGVGVTHMSSEASTEPGGYANPKKEKEGKQFIITDNRTTAEFSEMLRQKGLEPVWKDWDSAIV